MTLFFNYLNEPSVWVRVFVYLSLVITLLSGVDYLFKVMRKTDSQ